MLLVASLWLFGDIRRLLVLCGADVYKHSSEYYKTGPSRDRYFWVPAEPSFAESTQYTIENIYSPMYFLESANQAHNKNVAIGLATSELIQFFDMDDVLFPWSIAVAKTAYEINKAAIIFTHTAFESSTVTRFTRRNYIPYCTMSTGCNETPSFPFTPFCRRVCGDGMYHSTRLYKDCFWEHALRR